MKQLVRDDSQIRERLKKQTRLPPESQDPLFRSVFEIDKTFETDNPSDAATVAPGDNDHAKASGQFHMAYLAPPQMPDEIGRLGGYRVLKVLGTGGMGTVFLAEDIDLQRQVALKVMKSGMDNESHRERFLREARVMASVEHDHIVTVYQVGEDRGVQFLAMQLLQGEALDERLSREGRLPTEEIIRIGREAAEGLAAAHERGLIHRDIKPGNMWLEERSASQTSLPTRVKILDFGLARPIEHDVRLTQSGAILGTPAYMAPEQFDGEETDGRTDLYSLGCVLYQLAAGKLPFQADSMMNLMRQVLEKKPQPVAEFNPELPPKLADLIMALLNKSPDDRPASAREVADQLSAIEFSMTALLGAPMKAPSGNTQEVAGKTTADQPRNKPRKKLAAALLLLLITGGVLAYLYFSGVLIHVSTEKGTLVIQSDDPNVEVMVKKDGAVIIDRTGKRELHLKVGNYEIDLADKKSGLKLSTKAFTIERDGRTVVRVTFEPAPKEKPPVVIAKRSPFDDLKREDIPPEVLKNAGSGDPAKAPKELVAVWGESRFRSWGGITSIAFSPDQKRVALTSLFDKSARIWDVNTGEILVALPPRNNYTSISYSSDGKKLVTTGCGAVEVWDANTGKRLRGFTGEKSGYSCAVFSQDVKRLVACGGNKVVSVWDTDAGTMLHRLKGHSSAILGVAISSDGKWVASAGGADDTARIWDAATGKVLHIVEQKDTVHDVAFSADSKLVAIASADGAKVFKLGGDKLELMWSSKQANVRCISFDPAGSALIAYNTGYYTIVHDLGANRDICELRSNLRQVFSPDGKRLALVDRGCLLIRDLATKTESIQPQGYTSSINLLSVRPDGRELVTLSPHQYPIAMRAWQTATGRSTTIRGIEGHIRYSPNGQLLVCGGSPNIRRFTVMNVRNSLPLWTKLMQCHEFAFSRNSELLAVVDTLTNSKQIQILEAGTGRKVRTIGEHSDAIRSVAFHPDGKILASADAKQVKLWDVKTGKEIKSWERPISIHCELHFHPQGRQLAFVNHGSNAVTVIDSETGETLRATAGHSAMVMSIAYDPDGTQLASSDRAGVVIIRDVTSGKLVRQWQFGGAIYQVSFSPDGRHLITGNGNGTIYVLRLALPPDAASPSVFGQ